MISHAFVLVFLLLLQLNCLAFQVNLGRKCWYSTCQGKITLQSSRLAEILKEDESPRLRKARLLLAEIQGIVPHGYAEQIPLHEFENVKQLLPKNDDMIVSKTSESSWKVAEPELKYDPTFSKYKFWQQPLKLLKRNIEIFFPMSKFVISLIFDYLLGMEKLNRTKRAQELVQIMNQIESPALIKAGQVLSSRSDLLPQEYLQTFQSLQDNCQVFSNAKAMDVFEKEFGNAFSDIFELESTEPIAAASIGQVYKGRIKTTNELVAIKIQRPELEHNIALDLFLLRHYFQWIQNLINTIRLVMNRFQYLTMRHKKQQLSSLPSSSDSSNDPDVEILQVLDHTNSLVSIVDDFGTLLYREMDYR